MNIVDFIKNLITRISKDDVLDIFKQLYEAGYEIEKIRLIDEYDADESTSEEVAFNSFNSAIESLPMSERAKFASLVSSGAISMSCK